MCVGAMFYLSHNSFKEAGLNIRYYHVAFFLLSIILCGCQDETPASAPTEIFSEHVGSPTATATKAVVFPTAEAGVPEVDGGELEIRIPFDIYAPSEVTTSEDIECVTFIPFNFNKEEMRILLEGQGPIYCHFEDTPLDSPITFHVILDFNSTFTGELLEASLNKPYGWLDTYLMVDGAIIQYYSNYPPEAVNPCPESDPCRSPVTENIPLPFEYIEGNTLTTPWKFILHLK